MEVDAEEAGGEVGVFLKGRPEVVLDDGLGVRAGALVEVEGKALHYGRVGLGC